MVKTGCVIFWSDERFDDLAQCAVSSFRKFHPDIELHDINYKNFDKYNIISCPPIMGGPMKYIIAYKLMKEQKYDKMIILGSDTITCSRLEEFLNLNDCDVITSLDAPYQMLLEVKGKILSTPILYRKQGTENLLFDFQRADLLPYPEYEIIEHTHVNADVICFNNIDVLGRILKALDMKNPFKEQGALNLVLYHSMPKINNVIIDSPYCLTKILYNIRARGNISSVAGVDPHYEKYIQQYKVINNFLYTYDYKLIRVYHYCQSFGSFENKEDFYNRVKHYVKTDFNIETINFFCEQCDCEPFFIKYYFDDKP